MSKSTKQSCLVVAISSRALFDLDESHQVFVGQGTQSYAEHQIERESAILKPGVAFPLVSKLLALNTPDRQRIEVVLVSRNSAETGLRIFNSIQHYHLGIVRAAFTGGEDRNPYLEAFGAHLFLSSNAEDVRSALKAGFAAATILPSSSQALKEGLLRIAFDGDAVLFSDEAERVYQSGGLDAFQNNEIAEAAIPLQSGPFKKFLLEIHQIQRERPDMPIIRTALITARGAPAHERAVRTLRSWGIHIDEVLFLGGLDKGLFLKAFGADIFFDDQKKHCESTRQYVATGHVPHGIANEVKTKL